MKKIKAENLEINLDQLNIPIQAKKKLSFFKVATVSDFLCYDCPENTEFSSYGIPALKIGKNSRKRLYDELESKGIPRAFELSEGNWSRYLEASILELPLKIATINKLYRCGFKKVSDCLEQSVFTKKCLGEDYEEFASFCQTHNLKIKQVAVSDNLKLIDIENPNRLNVVSEGKIKKDHMKWYSKRYQWASEARYYGLETLGDVKELGYENFAEKNGNVLDSFFCEYEIDMPGYKGKDQIEELKEARLLLKLLLDAYEEELDIEEEEDVINFVKKRVAGKY